MLMLASTLLSVFFISFSAQAIYIPPSKLTNCNANRWEMLRLNHTSALQFRTDGDFCYARFEISPQDKKIHNGWRAEIEDKLRMQNRSQATYEFSTFLPKNLDDSSIPSLVLAQWHDNKRPGIPAQRPPLALRLRDGKLAMTLFNQKLIDKQGINGKGLLIGSTPAVFEKWIHWKIKAYWLPSNKGFVHVWMNGKPFAQFQGETSYPNDLTAPYFKLGIYTTHSFNKPLYVFHTNYKRTYAEPFPCDLKENQHRSECRRLMRQ